MVWSRLMGKNLSGGNNEFLLLEVKSIWLSFCEAFYATPSFGKWLKNAHCHPRPPGRTVQVLGRGMIPVLWSTRTLLYSSKVARFEGRVRSWEQAVGAARVVGVERTPRTPLQYCTRQVKRGRQDQLAKIASGRILSLALKSGHKQIWGWWLVWSWCPERKGGCCTSSQPSFPPPPPPLSP